MLTGSRKRAIFEMFIGETLARGGGYWWRPRGLSMAPTVWDGDRVLVAPVDPQRLRVGDVVKFKAHDGFRMHRLVWKSRKADGAWEFGFRGDNSVTPDPPVRSFQVVGLAVAVERRGRIERLDTWKARFRGRLKTLRWSIRERLRSALPKK